MYPKDIKKGITRKEGTDTKETSEIVGDRMKVGLSTGTREKNTNENPGTPFHILSGPHPVSSMFLLSVALCGGNNRKISLSRKVAIC